jgi:hypothetical protein
MILIAAHRTCDDALDDLIGFRETYPRRKFELERCDDGRERPWQIMLRIGRSHPWLRRLSVD